MTRCFRLTDNVLIEGIETEKDHGRARQAGEQDSAGTTGCPDMAEE